MPQPNGTCAQSSRPGDPDAEPVAEMSWSLTSEEPAPPDAESHLEQRFRPVFTERLTELGATVKESPGPQGNRLTITFPSAARQWTLEPQVLMGSSKPDFLLSSNQGGLPPVAIFADGWQYHASPAHNRIADDAQKRQNLRDGGAMVLGITARDVEHAQAGTIDAPAWLRDDVVAQLLSSSVTFAHQNVESIRRGPIDFLLAWIQKPDIQGHRALANHLPLMFAPNATHFWMDPKDDLSREAALRLIDPNREASDSGTAANAWWWSTGPVGCLTRMSGQILELALMVDDRDEVLRESHHADAWREWLRISNALNLREQPTRIATVTEMLAEAVPRTARATTVGGSDGLPPEWQAIWKLALDGAERTFVEGLARLGSIPVPVMGYETDSGSPIDFAWPDKHLAVRLEPDESDQHDLKSAGWHWIPADPAAVAAALSGGT